MTYRGNDKAPDVAAPEAPEQNTANRFSGNVTLRVKATVHQLPGIRRRQVPRCDGCGNPIAAGSALCETCASGAELIARIEDRRAASLQRQALGPLAKAGG